ncbi:MAG: VRR-NUC domain-containing protein [Gemmatimonadota bacterium]
MSPRAAIYNQKGKVQRYYWREITKTYYESLLTWSRPLGISIASIMQVEADYPAETQELKKAARRVWQQRHKVEPKYDMSERTPAQFLAEVPVPEIEVEAEYVSEQRAEAVVGKWRLNSTDTGSAEDVAAMHYRSLGFDVYRCERKLISMLVAVLLWPVIQDLDDPEVQMVMRGSTVGWRPDVSTQLIQFPLPRDFASAAYYDRREAEFEAWLAELEAAEDLETIFESCLAGAETLRDYLWVAEEDARQLARAALSSIPSDVILTMVRWAIRDFWNRQPGWPDLLVLGQNGYRFSEVKSPNDKLSLEQMRWFEWALVERENALPCEICRVVRKVNGS